MGRFADDALIPAAVAAALAVSLAPFLTGAALSDEIFTLDATALPWPAMWAHLRADVHPPLFYISAKAWLAVAGHSLEALRALSLLMAAAAAFLAARILPATVAGRSWAAWIFLADGIVINMSTYGRMYTMLAVLCLLAWLASDRSLRGASRAWQALAAVAVAAGLLTHHFFAIYLAALGIGFVLLHGRTALRLAAGWGAGAAVWALLWGRAAWEQAARRPQHLAWVPAADPVKWAEAAGAHIVFLLAAAPLALLAMAWRRREPAPWPRESKVAAVCGVLALALPAVLSVWRPVFFSRFTIIAAPFLAVALAPMGRRTSGVLPVAAFAAAAGWMWWANAQTVCTSAEAARLLAREAEASDTVLFCRMTRKPVEYHWPSPAPSRRSFPAEIDAHPGYEGRQTPQQLEEEARALASSLQGRVFLLLDSRHAPSQILLRALESAGYRQNPPLLACGSTGRHYFDRLLVLDPPVTLAESPSAAPPAPGSPPRGRDVRAYAPQ
ncbi:MAG: hypothetical protein WHT08_14795 [Bryobacteraceae bacterium]